jgi:hypothetical protein
MKKIFLQTMAIAFTIALFNSCMPSNNNYYPRSLVAQDNNDYRGQVVSKVNNYYFGPYISVVTGILGSKTIITTERRGNSVTYLYMLNTAGPINISKVNVPDDGDVITANNIEAFELAVCNMNLSAYIGSKVRVTGQFTLCDSGNDSTRVVMNVSKVEVYHTTPVPQQCPPPVTQQRPTPTTKTYRIQVGTYTNFANACNAMTQLQRENLNPVKENHLQYTRVVLPGIPANSVDNTVAAVKRAGFADVWVQPE